jgi:hypothetical protein
MVGFEEGILMKFLLLKSIKKQGFGFLRHSIKGNFLDNQAFGHIFVKHSK